MSRLVAAVLILLAVASAGTARAATRLYLIAIGNNQAPRDGGASPVQPLLYADDDAAAIASFAAQLGARTTLLTVMDADTRRLYPELLPAAVPPTLAELRRAAAWHRAQIEVDRRAGDESVVLLFFSGHGFNPAGGEPSLALLDGALTRAVLHDEVLASLPARYVHLLVDACHAEAVVRPRGADLPLTPVSTDEAHAALDAGTLARFPQAGAIMAAARAKEAHEWDRIRHGVFTYELLSALRGGADVNGDGRIEYSEVFAFVTAANRGVQHARATLDVRIYPPPVNPRAQLIDLRAAARAPKLQGRGQEGPIALRIEDDLGRSIATINREVGVGFDLALPSDRAFFVQLPDGREAEVRPAASERITTASLTWRQPKLRARGSADSALDRGLFATPFGPAFYAGVVGARPELMPVPLIATSAPAEPRGRDPLIGPAGYAFVGAGVLATLTGVLTVAALRARQDFDEAPYQRDSAEALDRMHLYRGLAIGSGIATAGAVGLGLYLKLRAAPVVEPMTAGNALGLSLRGRW